MRTQKTYSEVQRLDETDSEYVGAKLIDLITDQVAFFNTITDRKNSLESMLKADITLEDRRCSDFLAHRSLPPTEDMDKILRYEERMHRQLDWALQRLLEALTASACHISALHCSANLRDSSVETQSIVVLDFGAQYSQLIARRI